jgi:hypothetical protein
MSYQFGPRDPSSELVEIIRQVRRRWRMKLALRGALGVVGVGLLLLVLSALGLESWRFTPGAIITFRIILGVGLAGLVGYLLVRPLMRSASDEQVALYLEEHEPSLQAAIISAVEGRRADASAPYSAMLVGKLVESAVDKCNEIEGGRRVERVPVRRYGLTLAALAVGALALFGLGPAYLRHALSALFVVSRDVQAAAPYRIAVTPGNATVPRGADQTITAQLSGFDADQASLLVRKNPEAPFEPVALLRGDDGKYEGMLFDLAAPVSYFVEANGVRSDVFNLKVVELPYVQRLELEYRFPAYTGLPPQKVEDGGDIAVLRGTEIRVRAVPTMPSAGGQIVLSDTQRTALAPAAEGGSPAPLTGAFKVDKDGFYRIELDAPSGERVTASPQYTIDVLADQPPTVSISKPGRDTSASPIEEVFVEARADDDFGVRDLDLVYSVNGGAEKTLRLFDGKKRLAEVSAGHTFYLEELDVKAGDFVSYYAKAADNDGVQGPKPAMSDMYFVRVRPLSKEFRRAESDAGGGGGGGGGGGNQVGALSEQQRQIIAATFNVQRDRKKMTADKVRENAIVIALSQSRLREQVDGLLTRMNSRLVEQDPAFKKVAELLPQAVTEMKTAEAKLHAVNPEAALAPEQKALQHLQRAEEEYEMQVQMQRQQGGGGGGGGGSAMAQDLADLFEMELDKMANQYESRQQASQQQSDQKLDELMEKLKDLARRQEQEAERQRRRAALGQQASGGGSGQQQRDLADQAEEAARRLEQLSREENRPELMQSARQLRDAADAMRKAAANGQQGGGAQAAAALERLKEAERRLQRTQSGRGERDVKNALQQAEELAREQQEIAEDAGGLESAGERRQEKAQALVERKATLEQKVGELEKQLDQSASDLRAQEKETARKLAEGAESIRNNKVRDKIRYSSRMVRQGSPQAEQQAMEGSIGSNLESLKDTLQQAASALGKPSQADVMGQTLDRARQLARGVDSLDQRMRERQQRQQGRQRQPGQEGEGQQAQGQQGQQGEGRQGQQGEGQQGQQGEGQQGQEGQGQQGRGQQGQGQQGQGQQGQGQQGQGQEGQQGQGGQGGSNDGSRTQNGRFGNGDTAGRFNANGGYGDSRPGRFDGGRFDPDDVRQFRGEARQFVNDAQQLRRLVQGQGLDAKALDEVLRNLRALDDDRVYQDAATLERLQAAVSEGMKRFEFNLRRQADVKGTEVFLSGSDEVPEEYRKLVEQYYKSLSKAPGAPDAKPDVKKDERTDEKKNAPR